MSIDHINYIFFLASFNDISPERNIRATSIIEKPDEDNGGFFLNSLESKLNGMTNDLINTIERELVMNSTTINLERTLQTMRKGEDDGRKKSRVRGQTWKVPETYQVGK